MVPELVEAGLPTSSVAALLAALASGSASAIEAVPGVTAQIVEVGAGAYKAAYADAFKTVFLASIAFGGVATIAALLYKEMQAPLSHDVVRRLDGGKNMLKSTNNVDEIEKV